MASTIIKNHDHSFKIDFSPNPHQEFNNLNEFFIFELIGGAGSIGEGANFLRLNGFSDEIYLEQNLGSFNVAADENNIFIQNVPNGILPEELLSSLYIKVLNHSNNDLNNNHFNIQLVSKSTSIINSNNFDYTYTIDNEFDTNIPFDLSIVILAEKNLDLEDYNFKKEFQWSQDNINWNDYEDLETLNEELDVIENCCDGCSEFPIDPNKKFYFRILYTRIGLNNNDTLVVTNICVLGEYEIKIKRVGELAKISKASECIELIQTDIYKVFKLNDYNIDSIPDNISNIANIRFKISQDNCRSWSDWCFLTLENIQNYKVDPLRFFHIKYSICLPDDYYGNGIKIYDIILNGEFQNVTVDYANGGKLGLRPEVSNRPVQQGITLDNGGANYCSTLDGKSISSTPLGSNDGDMILPAVNNNAAWNPYSTNTVADLYNNMSNIASDTFGHEITYFPLNPDANGIDRVFHEYQLMNVDECGDIKVLVPDNQFPDSQIKFTAFNLELFETFEIHITKDMFKNMFGIERRPTKRDFLFFPILNRMFEVEHAQFNKDFLNTSTFYRVTLKKYNVKSNIKMSDGVKTAHDALTNNTSLDSLFGLEKEAEDKIVNKEQFQTLSDDRIRLLIDNKVIIEEENLYNASLIFSKTHYDFSTIEEGINAVTYTKSDNILSKGDNRAISLWFNLKELENIEGGEFIFMNNYDNVNNIGYKAWLLDGKVYFKINSNTYELPVVTIQKNTWYCLLINITQCDKLLDIHIFKRFTTYINGIETDGTELASSRLDEKWHKQFIVEPEEFILDDNFNTTIQASQMKMTNIRLFNNNIDKKSFTKVLNQYIIKKSNHLIFADNANEKIQTSNHA